MSVRQESLNRNFHVPLPDDVYQALRSEAERRRRPATALVREVLEEWLERRRAEALHEEITEYAATHAGTSADLDSDLEAAGIETLTRRATKSKGAARKRKAHAAR